MRESNDSVSTTPHQWHFVHTSLTSDVSSKERSRRMTRSQAAKSAHNKKRQQRTLEFLKEKAQAERSQVQLLGQATLGCRSDPFMSSARVLQPIEHSLLDHYVTSIVPLMRCNDAGAYFYERMRREWLPLALTDDGLLVSILLAACRNLARKQHPESERYAQLAVKYKLECLHSLRTAIAMKKSFDNAVVAKAISLAYDELAIGNVAMSKHHVDGAVKMVHLNGGPQTLGLNGFLEHMMSRLLVKVALDITVPIAR